MSGDCIMLALELMLCMVKANGAMAVCMVRAAVNPIWAFGSVWRDLRVGIIGGMRGMFVSRDSEGCIRPREASRCKDMDGGHVDEFYYGKYLPQSISRRFLKDSLVVVRTDIVDSTSLWNLAPHAMHRTIGAQDEIARRLCRVHKGLEVRNEGDSFFLVFADAWNALDFSVEFYREVRRIPLRFGAPEDTRPDGIPLRVRIAMDAGPVVLRQDEFLGVYGDVVSKTLEMLDHSKGRICVSESCLKPVKSRAEDRLLFCIHK